MPADLVRRLADVGPRVFADTPVLFAYPFGSQFGSQARGMARSGSDVALPRDAVRYRLVTAIEGLVAAARHVIASERLRLSEAYADTFTVLGEADPLEERLADTAVRVARFRNLFVHEFATVDDRGVGDILQTRPEALVKMRAALVAVASDRGRGEDG